MSTSSHIQVFGSDHAKVYDKTFDKISAVKEALFLAMSMVLTDLPTDARILIVGAGTGDDLIHLAKEHPGWTFTAVEPAHAMLEVCKEKVENLNFTARCTFHEGYLDTLPTTELFHGATSIFVSQFCVEPGERVNFFKNISSRLHPEGILVSADQAADTSDPQFDGLLDAWLRTMKYATNPTEQQQLQRRAMFFSGNPNISIVPKQEVEKTIKSGGFSLPVLIYQFMVMCTWYAKKSSELCDA